jgi:hypothetical protein
MPVWKIICFLLSSLLYLSACKAPTALQAKPKADCPAVYDNRGKDVRYKANINVAGKHMSGILVLKETAIDTTHAIFITETGFRIFDVLVLQDTVLVSFMLSAMNTRLVRNLLCEDMRLLTHPDKGQNPNIVHRNKQLSVTFVQHRTTTEYRCSETCDTLNFILFRKKGVKKVKVQFYGMKNRWYERIALTHFNVPMKMNLELIEE